MPILDDTPRLALAQMVEQGPTPDLHAVVRWRVAGLCQKILTEFQIEVTRQTLSRELRGMGCRKLSARPRHPAQATGAIVDFKAHSKKCEAVFGIKCVSKPKVKAARLIQIKSTQL